MLSSQPSSLLLIFPGLLIAAEAPDCSEMLQDTCRGRKVPIRIVWCIPPQGEIRCCAGIGAFPVQTARRVERPSWSSCFSREGENHGFSDTLLPWQIPGGQKCWGDTMGMKSAQCFYLPRTDLCWQWQKSLPGIWEGKRPGLETASLQSCDPNAPLLPMTGLTWQSHLAACDGDTTTLLRGWHIPMGPRDPEPEGAPAQGTCLTQTL